MRQNRRDKHHRYFDAKCEVTFHGKVYAPSPSDGAAHTKAVVSRRLHAMTFARDPYFELDGFTTTGIVVSARSKESKKAELERLKQLTLKYPNEALAAIASSVAQVTKRRKQ